MSHLDEHQAIDLIESGDSNGFAEHVASCSRCSNLVEGFRRAIESLAACRQTPDEPPLRLVRWARAYAGIAASAKPKCGILELISGGAFVAAEVRQSGATTRSMLYGNDAFQVDIRMTSSVDLASFELHGQVVPIDETVDADWKICVVGSEKPVEVARTGQDGEFWFHDLEPAGPVSLLIENNTQRLVLPRLMG